MYIYTYLCTIYIGILKLAKLLVTWSKMCFYTKWPSPFGRVTVTGLEKCLSMCLYVFVVTPLYMYLKNWTLLDFHTWRVYTPPKWQERALTNIFSTIPEAIKTGKKPLSVFLHLTKHEFHITGCLNNSSFQQSKLEPLNIYISKVIKLTKVSWNTPPIIIAKLTCI